MEIRKDVEICHIIPKTLIIIFLFATNFHPCPAFPDCHVQPKLGQLQAGQGLVRSVQAGPLCIVAPSKTSGHKPVRLFAKVKKSKLVTSANLIIFHLLCDWLVSKKCSFLGGFFGRFSEVIGGSVSQV